MSGVGFYMTTPEIALVATTPKSPITIVAAADHRVLIYRIGLFFDGQTVNNEPVDIKWSIITVDGTGTAGTPQKKNPSDDEALQVDFTYNYTSGPTFHTSTWLRFYVHPQTGLEIPFPTHKPWIINGGDRWGLQCTAQNNVNVVVNIEGEE
jgi:hypothetical protein